VSGTLRPPRPPFPDWRQIERARLLLAEAAVVLRDLAAVDLPVPDARYLDAWALELAAASRFLDAAEEVSLALRTCHASTTMLQRAAWLRGGLRGNAPRESDASNETGLKPFADPAEKKGER